MAGNDSNSRSIGTSNTATRAMRSTIPLAPPRDRPMYFEGQQQSEEFARGAWAACDVWAKLQAQFDGVTSSVGEMTVALAGEFNDNIAIGGQYARGFIAEVAEILAFGEMVGTPNFEVWRPLRMELRFTRRGAHPTPGSKLFDYDGVPVAVAPDQTCHSWGADGEIERDPDPEFLERVLRGARPISERQFNALRVKVEKEVAHG